MIEWKITNLFASLSDSEVDQQRPNSAIVVRAEWLVAGREGSVSANVAGIQEFIYDPATDFTPYWDLTEAQVLGWVHAAMGGQRQSYEDMVMQQIEQKKAEPINLPLPWHQTPVVDEVVSSLPGNDTLFGGNVNDTLGGLK